MKNELGLFARWSRRKRIAARRSTATGTKESVAATPKAGEQDATSAQTTPYDLARLPALESIGPQSDISAFLDAAVPPTLTREALRRAWAVDPKIRDFIGLSENSWDFTAPDSMPGFGSLTAEEIRRLVDQLAAASNAAPALPRDPPPENAAAHVADNHASHQPVARGGDYAAAPQTRAAEQSTAAPPRRHGGALPRSGE